jgi:uncharacterized membrane protein
MNALINNDAIVLGLLFVVLGAIFYTSKLKSFKRFYAFFPPLLLCYFVPGILNSTGIIDGESSKLYFVSSRYLLPAILILLTLSVDLPAIIKLGPKALIMFFAATFGIVIGGPLAILLTKYFFPSLISNLNLDDLWRGMSTIAGSWIGGGANQASMKEIFNPSDQLFSMMIIVDVFVANIWMAVLLFMASRSDKIDNYLKADLSAINQLKDKMEKFRLKNEVIPSTHDLMLIAAIAFGLTGLSHFFADLIAPSLAENFPALTKLSLTSGFFWLIIFATTFGVALSFTPVKKIEGAGASKIASVMLYVLIASIGMHMDIFSIFKSPGVFVIGLIWMTFHALTVLVVGKLIKAPLFYIAVGSQANVGGAASAPIVASCFHPSLAPVGVLLAVFGYFVGTYGAWLCAQLMRWVSI